MIFILVVQWFYLLQSFTLNFDPKELLVGINNIQNELETRSSHGSVKCMLVLTKKKNPSNEPLAHTCDDYLHLSASGIRLGVSGTVHAIPVYAARVLPSSYSCKESSYARSLSYLLGGIFCLKALIFSKPPNLNAIVWILIFFEDLIQTKFS